MSFARGSEVKNFYRGVIGTEQLLLSLTYDFFRILRSPRLARAKSEGKTLGRKPKTTLQQRAAIIKRYGAEESVSALARQYNVSRATILGIVNPKAQ